MRHDRLKRPIFNGTILAHQPTMLDWLPHERAWRWFFGALAFGLLLLAADAVGRSVYAIRKYGFRTWIRSLFKVEPEHFRVIGVLILLVVATLLMWLRGGG
jgi:hypothetical protein